MNIGQCKSCGDKFYTLRQQDEHVCLVMLHEKLYKAIEKEAESLTTTKGVNAMESLHIGFGQSYKNGVNGLLKRIKSLLITEKDELTIQFDKNALFHKCPVDKKISPFPTSRCSMCKGKGIDIKANDYIKELNKGEQCGC